jgi:hypothetical protein
VARQVNGLQPAMKERGSSTRRCRDVIERPEPAAVRADKAS